MRLSRLRWGELLALAGAICLIVALTLPWYQSPEGKISAWSSFGPAVVLLIVGAVAALTLVLATITERSTALPVAAAVWGTLFGVIACVAALVRLLERPDHASALCAGAWVALAGAILILVGCWQSMRDERPELYEAPEIELRPPPR